MIKRFLNWKKVFPNEHKFLICIDFFIKNGYTVLKKL